MFLKSVHLIRHGTAASHSSFESDLERPLTELGRQESQNLGRVLSYLSTPPPDVIFYTPALRSSQTMAGLISVLPMDFSKVPLKEEPLFLPDGFPQQALARLLKGWFGENQNSIWVVGHNPLLETLMRLLLQDSIYLPREFERCCSLGLQILFKSEGTFAGADVRLSHWIPRPSGILNSLTP
jgi:phosphohistidine phosphatase